MGVGHREKEWEKSKVQRRWMGRRYEEMITPTAPTRDTLGIP